MQHLFVLIQLHLKLFIWLIDVVRKSCGNYTKFFYIQYTKQNFCIFIFFLYTYIFIKHFQSLLN